MSLKMKPMYAVIAPSEIAEKLMPRCGIKPEVCEFYAQGVNDIYRVVSCGEKYYVRVSLPGIRTRDEIDAELKLLSLLDRSGVSAAQPVLNDIGEAVTEVECAGCAGSRYAVVFREAKGEVVGERSPGRAAALGTLLAKFHSAADNFGDAPRKINSEYLVDAPLEIIGKCYAGTEYTERLGRAGERIRNAVDYLWNSGDDIGVIHGDIHNYNIRFDGDKPTMFDFDSFGVGPRSYDLAVQRWNIMMLHLPQEDGVKQWETFAAGYSSVRKLPIEKLGILVAARDLWLIGTELRATTVNRERSWVNDEFLRGKVDRIEMWSSI